LYDIDLTPSIQETHGSFDPSLRTDSNCPPYGRGKDPYLFAEEIAHPTVIMFLQHERPAPYNLSGAH